MLGKLNQGQTLLNVSLPVEASASRVLHVRWTHATLHHKLHILIGSAVFALLTAELCELVV